MKRMKTFLLSGTVAVGLFAIIGASPALAAKKPGGGTTSASCPKGGTANLLTYDDVTAYATPIDGGFDYFFTSTASDPPPSGGVPGLVKYCVYPSWETGTPSKPDVTAIYPNWIASTSNRSPYPFSFGRPGGNDTNVPLDGNNPQEIGTATWTEPPAGATPPTSQNIVLHIADPKFCVDSPTCFVKPKAGPICDAGAGDDTFAYNSMPFDVIDCSPPSQAFEGTQTREFGDEVVLDTSLTGNTLDSLIVDFQSYGCRDSGHWQLGTTDPCVTNAPGTFTHPITARIYAASSGGVPGALLATSTNPPFTDIPFRPSAEGTGAGSKCPGGAIPSQGIEAGSQWYNPVWGTCQYSIGKKLTFDSWDYTAPFDGTLPSPVIWTVAFNTTHYGYNPIGEDPTAGVDCFATAVGCGYDSLNVGTKTYSDEAFAGADFNKDGAFLSSTWVGSPAGNQPNPNSAYCDTLLDTSLRLDQGDPAVNDCWFPYRPLAAITTTTGGP